MHSWLRLNVYDARFKLTSAALHKLPAQYSVQVIIAPITVHDLPVTLVAVDVMYMSYSGLKI